MIFEFLVSKNSIWGQLLIRFNKGENSIFLTWCLYCKPVKKISFTCFLKGIRIITNL